jgi:hypothetical protein
VQQEVGVEADIGLQNRGRPVHEPDAGLAIVVLPQDIALAVAVEIAAGFDTPTYEVTAANSFALKLR